jgi:hypothetical protein
MKTYVITTASPGDRVDACFLNSILKYCEVHNAELIVLSTQKRHKDDELDEAIRPYVLRSSRYITRNWFISLFPISSEAVDPLIGIDRLVNVNGSSIHASPKQRLKTIPDAKRNGPKFIMSTGAITIPPRGSSRRVHLARIDHVTGAVVLNVTDKKRVYFRHIESDEQGAFYDLGVRYSGNGIERSAPLGLVLGDWHTGHTDERVRLTTFGIIKHLKPQAVFLHDFFDGSSVNHHTDHKILEKSMGQLSLTHEIMTCATELALFEKIANQVFVVNSNHNEFLSRYLVEGRYNNDPTNHILGLELALALANGANPLEYAVRRYVTLTKTEFLTSECSLKIAGFEVAQHGHRGPNGSRGSLAAFERAFGSVIIGHTHTPEILRGATCVGTSTNLSLSYNSGPSSWAHAHCLIYPNKTRQLLVLQKGQYEPLD